MIRLPLVDDSDTIQIYDDPLCEISTYPVLGNRKLGTGIFHFSLPAILTCPGRSDACERLCYADEGFYAYPSVRQTLWRNFLATKDPDFVLKMKSSLATQSRELGVNTVRIHASGDFYSVEYLLDWVTIIEQLPTLTFFFYTRSWEIPAMRGIFETLSQNRRVHVWYSCDRDMPDPFPDRSNRTDRVRLAWMQQNDSDLPPFATDLVFRVNTTTPLKRVGTTRVCPVEQGITRQISLTCTRCRICFTSK